MLISGSDTTSSLIRNTLTVTSASTYVTNTLANGQTTTQAVAAGASTSSARPSSAGAAQAVQTAGLFVPMGVAVAALGFAVGL